MARRRARFRAHSQTRAYEVFRYRRFAVWKGIGLGLLILGVSVGVAAYVVIKSEAVRPDAPSFWWWLIGAPGGVALGVGIYGWVVSARDDREHRRLQQAPSLPLRLVRDHDDVWIEGRVRCPRPLRPPHHRHRCVWYHLEVEERRGSGKNRRWVTILDTTRRTPAYIVDDTREIALDVSRASIDYPIATTRRSGDRRYNLERLPARGRIAACGVVRRRVEVRARRRREEPVTREVDWPDPEEVRAARAALHQRKIAARVPEDPDRDLPPRRTFRSWHDRHEQSQVKEERRALRRSHRARRNRLRRARARRRGGRRRGRARAARPREPRDPADRISLDDIHGVPREKRLILTSHDRVPHVITPLTRAQWHDRAEADERVNLAMGMVLLVAGIPMSVWTLGSLLLAWPLAFHPGGPVGFAVMAAALLPGVLIRRYNRFVVYRRRIQTARAHLDVDLKMRHDLVPQLVKVVRAYAEHERGVLDRVSEIRATAANLGGALRALKEGYPDLGAEPLFAQLFDDIIACEEKIAFGRALVRDSITEYNDTVATFPSSLWAGILRFRPEPLPTA